MESYFVFVDMDYYPYVGDPVEAESPEDALRIATENERPGNGVTVYVAPMACVLSGTMHGPRPKPEGLLSLLEKQNRYNAALSGALSVRVEAGSIFVRDS